MLRTALHGTLLQPPKVRLVRERKQFDPRTLYLHEGEAILQLDSSALSEAVSSGATLVVNDVGEQLAGVASLCGQISKELRRPASANLYWSELQLPAFGIHSDDHDVVIVQCTGHKSWYFPDDAIVALDQQTRSEPCRIELHPNSWLFVPCGVRHEAVSTGVTSVHLTIGLGR